MPAQLMLILAIMAEVIATSALKASENFSRPGPSVLAVLGYGASFYLLAQTLNFIPVGIVYAVWSGCGIVLITIVGWIVFGQRLDAAGFLGMALIIAGVLVLNLLSKSSVH